MLKKLLVPMFVVTLGAFGTGGCTDNSGNGNFGRDAATGGSSGGGGSGGSGGSGTDGAATEGGSGGSGGAGDGSAGDVTTGGDATPDVGGVDLAAADGLTVG